MKLPKGPLCGNDQLCRRPLPNNGCNFTKIMKCCKMITQVILERDYFAKSARRLNSINILDLQAGNTFFSGNAFFSKEHASEDTVLLFVIFLAKL
mmetsp:Transcript_8085/g.10871  ORF Transcript_8085/g.10871 Transcript_8085/m.10871 type:complete len:95 (+) Transcript_8085:930-1214(+)